MTGDLTVTPWKCPFCVAGLTGPDGERCHHCSGTGLTDDPCGGAERAPRPPGVMRTACADCAFRPGSPELEGNGAQLPDEEPFYCHQGLPISATGSYTPTAMFRGLPLGAMVCAGWWALVTGEDLPAREYREVPVDPGKEWDLPYALRDQDATPEQVARIIAASSLGAPGVAELAARTSPAEIADMRARVERIETSPYRPVGLTIPAEWLDDSFPLGAFFQGLGAVTRPTATEADYVAAWLGEPARDPRVESVPCPLCSADPGSVCRQPYGPDHWIPASLHHERHEVLAEQILVDALQDMCENPPPSMQFVVGSTPTVPPPAPCTLADLTALYARLNPPKENDL
jgi:hypothetical protein